MTDTHADSASRQLAIEAAEAATANALAEAIELLPQTFLHYADPVTLLDNAPPLTPETEEAREEAIAQAMASYVSPYIQAQSRQMTERPVVTTTDKILNAALPPRTFSYLDPSTNQEVIMVQPVSSQQASRPELRELKEILDFKIDDAKARMSGLCPVRRSIFSMLLDELIRQVAVGCPERGLLLLRFRDEARLSVDAYKSLCENAAHYGTSKLHQGSKGKPEMLSQIKQLTQETDDLRKEVRRLETKHLSLLRCSEEQKTADHRQYTAETAFLKETTDRLQKHLQDVKDAEEREHRRMLSGGTAE